MLKNGIYFTEDVGIILVREEGAWTIISDSQAEWSSTTPKDTKTNKVLDTKVHLGIGLGFVEFAGEI